MKNSLRIKKICYACGNVFRSISGRLNPKCPDCARKDIDKTNRELISKGINISTGYRE